MQTSIAKKSWFVSGGTGSFGSAFTKRILELGASRVVVFSRDEQKQEILARNLAYLNTNDQLRFFLGTIRDKQRLTRAMQGTDIVVHGAALKIIGAGEYNPSEFIQTNIIGSENIVFAALECGVKKVIALSSDKSVAASTHYGKTKAAMESVMVRANAYSGVGPTRFACVRYGNVLASRGSVIHLWKEQAARGKPLTITDPRSTRYWLTVDQGVDFVLSCLDVMQGGEIYIPKIPSMSVTEMANAIVPDAKQRVVGLRAWEKLHEVLVANDEARQTRDLGDRYVILPVDPSWPTDFDGLGKPVDAEFEYRSDTNTDWLSAEQMRAMLEGVE